MLWGYHQIADFDRLVVNGYADCVLGMNECVFLWFFGNPLALFLLVVPLFSSQGQPGRPGNYERPRGHRFVAVTYRPPRQRRLQYPRLPRDHFGTRWFDMGPGLPRGRLYQA
jgi:hypothetical protein